MDAGRARYVAEHPSGVSFCNAYGHVLFGDPALRHFGREGELPVSITEPQATTLQVELRVDADNSIRFSLPEAGKIRLEVWNVAGHRVQTLFNGWASRGTRRTQWNTRDLASGAYLITLKTDGATRSVKAVVMR